MPPVEMVMKPIKIMEEEWVELKDVHPRTFHNAKSQDILLKCTLIWNSGVGDWCSRAILLLIHSLWNFKHFRNSLHSLLEYQFVLNSIKVLKCFDHLGRKGLYNLRSWLVCYYQFYIPGPSYLKWWWDFGLPKKIKPKILTSIL